MKTRYYFSIIFCILFNSVFPQDTVTVYYDKNWQEIEDGGSAVYYRKAFPDSNKLWSVRDYYISDKIQMTGTYKTKKSEVKHGHFVYYYENGQRKSEGDFVNNNREGIWTGWYENGQVDSKGKFLKGRPEGAFEYWHETGGKAAEGVYLEGRKNGLWQYWHPNGKLKSEENYLNENVFIAKGYSENGKLLYKGGFNNLVRQGDWVYYNVDGRIYFSGKFNNGVMEGEWIRYFREGSMKIMYIRGNPIGKHFGGIAGRE